MNKIPRNQKFLLSRQNPHLVDLGAVWGWRAHGVVSRCHGARRSARRPRLPAHIRHVGVVLRRQDKRAFFSKISDR